MAKLLGMVSAYAYAVSKGYTGTEDQFATLMASYADVGQTAVDAALAASESEQAAAASETAAAGSASAAATSASTAGTAATTATGAASTATAQAQSATSSATAAAESATTATNKAAEAAQSATAAAGSATTAGTAATAAQTAQTAAETAQGKAEDAQAAAEAAAQTLVIDPTLTQANQAAEAKATGDAITLVKSHLNATEIVDTASGAIATFADGSDGVPVESLTVTMEPIQDLHGQDAPYPAGGGKNLLDPALFVEQAGWYIIELTLTPNTAYTMSSNMPLAKADELPVYFKTDNFGGGNAAILVYTGHPVTQTSDENGHLYISERRVSGTDVFSNYQWQIELGSTATTYAPYSNICPISGRSAVTVTRSGVNVWDEEWEVGSYDTEGRPIIDVSRIRTKNRISVVGGTAYYMKAPNTLGIRYYDINDAFISGGYSTTVMNNISVAPNRAAYLRFSVVGTATYGNDISINYPATDTAYHPGTVASVTIQLGDTVYGGSLNVTSGVLTVKRAFVDLGTLTWTTSASGRHNTTPRGIKPVPNTQVANMQCSAYRTVAGNTIANEDYVIGIINNSSVQINDSTLNGSDAATFKAAMSGVQLVYELATPQTVQLSPQTITSLLGQNNVWSDAGDVSVDYVADPKLFIEQLTVPDADMVADANITSGQYFMVGNTLYLATANIASGASIVPGVNCTRTSLAEALNAINA